MLALSRYLFCSVCFAVGGQGKKVLHAAPALPPQWHSVTDLIADDHHMTVSFSLRQNLDMVFDVARSVSDPAGPKYGQHLSKDELEQMSAPMPSDINTVERWLQDAGIKFTRQHELIHTTFAARAAAQLLDTQLQHITNDATKQQATIAGDYFLPEEVHNAIAAVYGLHTLPLPPHSPVTVQSSTVKSDPPRVKVTPDVIRTKYEVNETPSGSMKNRQAVAEFQGQSMGVKDLEIFFQNYVPHAKPSDSKIYKFVGETEKVATSPAPGLFGPSFGVEATLDVDAMMGVAPGVLTEFWFFNQKDFCGALKNWSSHILASDAPPLVHSVSYGIQQNISSEIGCTLDVVHDLEADFAKLATRGVTILVASGDSGSGYIVPPSCPDGVWKTDTGIVGKDPMKFNAMEASECCYFTNDKGLKSWEFTPASTTDQCKDLKNATAYEGELLRDEQATDAGDCCNSAAEIEAVAWTYTPKPGSTYGDCRVYKSVNGTKVQKDASSGSVVFGQCLGYNETTGTTPKKRSISGGDAAFPHSPKMWASWPASSQWVTSVGATKFGNQDVKQPEVATETFGSGGGFSDYFPALKEQVAATQQYLKNAPNLPPTGSFPPGGRGTPDIAALGEFYQIEVNNGSKTADGTSASTPAVAALIALLNDVRIQAGKPAMGYLNPWMYSNPDMFNDVVQGTNALGRGSGPLPYGFNCTVGWDPVTGLGTPIFSKMKKSAMAIVEHRLEVIV